MRFEAAVSALLAAEFVTAEGASSQRSLEETAQFRKQAIESIANLSKSRKENKQPFLEIQKHRNGRSLRDHGTVLLNRHVNELSRKMSDLASGQEQRKQNEASGHVPDLGVLASPPKKEESNQKHRSGRRLRDRGSDFFNRQAKELSRKLSDVASNQEQHKQKETHGNVPDFGILASPPKKQGSKLPVLGRTISSSQLKNDKTSSDELSSDVSDTTTDLGILPSISTKKKRKMMKSKVQKLKEGMDQILQKINTHNDPNTFRRMEDPGAGDNYEDDVDNFMENFLDGPISVSATTMCLVSDMSPNACVTCGVTEINEDMYNVKIDCPNFPEEYKYNFKETLPYLQGMCSDQNICESCTVNYDNFLVDMQECTKGKFLEGLPDGFEEDYMGGDMPNDNIEDYAEDVMNYLVDAVTQNGPLASFGSLVCADEMASSYCETCELTYIYDDSGEKTGTYNLKMDCPNVPENYNAGEADEGIANLEYYCIKYSMCESCDMDPENFVIDVKGCNFFEAVSDLYSGEFYDDIGNEDENMEDDTRDTVIDSIMENGPLASFGLFCADENADRFCNTCELTYQYDDSGSKTNKYSLQMDCPDVPEEAKTETIFNLEYYCTYYNLCNTCSGNGADFIFDFQECDSDAFLAQIKQTVALQSVVYAFDDYFGPICADSTCVDCGRSSPDDSSYFSFSINCPSKLSASENGFGTYMIRAQAFCFSPEAQGVECSTCDVDPWAATIKISDCVAIDPSQDIAPSANSTGIAPDDEETFVLTYQRFCNAPKYYLQDSIGSPNCDCRFDEATQTVSFNCLYEESCREIDSYCPEEPLVFCETYRVNASQSKSGAVKLNRCVNFTSPYEFSYCVSYGMNEDDVATNDTKAGGSRGCEMEVNGIQCNECDLVGNNWGSDDFGSLSVDVLYNCSNTVIGTNGPGNLSQYRIIDDTVSYFIYQSLPCFGGCDLCGVGSTRPGYLDPKTNFMTKPDGKFSSEFWNSGEEERCFDAQLGSLTLDQRVSNDECAKMRESAREPCGCENPNPTSGAQSFRTKPTFTAGVVLLTLTSASFAQMLFG